RVVYTNWWRALLIFCILHLLVYPASNGYNSYMDRDKGSIGGIRQPMTPTVELFIVSFLMDLAAVLLSLLVSVYFALGILLYILASRAYSYRGIRLKQYPLIGYCTVVIFQGAVTFWLVYYGCHEPLTFNVPAIGMVASSLLIGGFYPLTQIYQHQADAADGVKSISQWLGYRGTFIFTATVYSIAFMVLAYHFFVALDWDKFFVLATCMLPILVYFFIWARKVWKDVSAASFDNTMRMNKLAAVCTNTGFIILVIWKIVAS
ncbi:MAG TPA: UbiA family prenyltransferase, partial [Chitinophagaceae bacterium]|nr:UbiA family prenyltransferase [Chitinophagaceae bacterium]